MSGKDKEPGKPTLFQMINWKKLILFLIVVGSLFWAYNHFEKEIDWILVGRAELQKTQLKYHLYGRTPIA